MDLTALMQGVGTPQNGPMPQPSNMAGGMPQMPGVAQQGGQMDFLTRLLQRFPHLAGQIGGGAAPPNTGPDLPPMAQPPANPPQTGGELPPMMQAPTSPPQIGGPLPPMQMPSPGAPPPKSRMPGIPAGNGMPGMKPYHPPRTPPMTPVNPGHMKPMSSSASTGFAGVPRVRY